MTIPDSAKIKDYPQVTLAQVNPGDLIPGFSQTTGKPCNNYSIATLQAYLAAGSGYITSAANEGIGGVPVYLGEVLTTIRFASIAAASSKVTVTFDTPTNRILVDVDPSAIGINNLAGINHPSKGGTGLDTSSSTGFPELTAGAWLIKTASQLLSDLGALPTAGGTMTGALVLNSNANLPLEPVSLQQMNSALVGLWDDRGNYDASTNLFPATGGSGIAGAVLKGDIWTISVIGTLGGTAVALGDTVRSLIDAPGQTSGNWAISNSGLGYTPLSNTLNSANMFVGNNANIATPVTITGDISIDNVGLTAINPAKVTNSMLAGATDAAHGGTGLVSPTANSIFIAQGAGAMTLVSFLDGQILIGRTGLSPIAAIPSAGAYAKITPGAGSLIFNSTLNTKEAVDLGIEFLTTTTVRLKAGKSRDSTDAVDLVLGSNQVIDFSLNGAVNRLDAGVIALNADYAIYEIASSDGVTLVGGLASLNFSAPALPPGYTLFRYVGFVRTAPASAQILDFQQSTAGRLRKYVWRDTAANLTVLTAGNATAFTALLLDRCMSPKSTVVRLRADYNPQAAGNSFSFRNTGSTVSIANSINRYSRGTATGLPVYRSMVDVITNSSRSVDWAVENASDSLTLIGYSFEEEI